MMMKGSNMILRTNPTVALTRPITSAAMRAALTIDLNTGENLGRDEESNGAK